MFVRLLPGSDLRSSSASSRRPVTRATTHADQHRRILRALGELVAKRGYADVTGELIVRRAHVSYVTFYKHFSDKEDCFVALFDEAVASTERAIREGLEAEDRPWAEQVGLALQIWVDQILADPLIARAVIVEASAVGPAIASSYERAIRAFVPLFRGGREFNPRGADLPETIEETLASSVYWSAYQYLVVGEPEGLREVLPEIVEFVLRTYLGQPEAARIARSHPEQLAASA